MRRLKLLMLWNLNFSGSLNFLSSELGYLYWGKYPFTCLPSSFQAYLVELILPRSNIVQLWKGTKVLPNLTHIDLSHSKNLIKMPNFKEIPNLESLALEGCIKLVKIDPSIEILYLGGNNFVILPSNIKELSKLRRLNLQHCKQLKYLPELPSNNALPTRRTTYLRIVAEFNIFDCPSLIDVECCYIMAFSWMIQFLQMHMQSEIPIEQITIVIPKTEIPMWLDKQNVGSSISMDPSPIMDDKNWIGVVCCLTFVALDNPTTLSKEQPSACREEFIGYYMTYLTEVLHDISCIELRAIVRQPLGLHLEAKNCGYRWIFKEDLEQLNSQIYNGNSSVQPYY
ncbi:unnamed protein product [Vicia faba]|uniref:Uncharacterized protein n=1 Tax=Vicia faba TaxID=3906 RepID=A0AAV0YSX0_VICFA|nr:unnamed protein product [Vicia faba]